MNRFLEYLLAEEIWLTIGSPLNYSERDPKRTYKPNHESNRTDGNPSSAHLLSTNIRCNQVASVLQPPCSIGASDPVSVQASPLQLAPASIADILNNQVPICPIASRQRVTTSKTTAVTDSAFRHLICSGHAKALKQETSRCERVARLDCCQRPSATLTRATGCGVRGTAWRS